MSLKATVHFKIPGKTFLVGEYLALFGGPSIVLTTNPLFEIFCRSGKGSHPFHSESPAGKYIARFPDFFSQWDLEFKDPYVTGGFGASTAQFIAVYLLHAKNSEFEKEKFFSTKRQIALDAWKSYRGLHLEASSSPSLQASLSPSGADLVAQIVGGLSAFTNAFVTSHSSSPGTSTVATKADPQIETLLWPFQDKDLLVFKTNTKVATHEHLAQSQFSEKLQSALRPVAQAAVDALMSAQWDHWLRAQEAFRDILEHHHLVHSDTQLLLQKIYQIPGVLHARGCGALGADVIAITIEKNQKDAILQEATLRELKDLKFMGSLQNDLAYGTFIDVTGESH